MKNKTVFYSWQSDLPEETNKQHIRKSIKKALIKVNQEYKIESSPRGSYPYLEIDHDIKDGLGSPEIVKMIFNKSDNYINNQ